MLASLPHDIHHLIFVSLASTPRDQTTLHLEYKPLSSILPLILTSRTFRRIYLENQTTYLRLIFYNLYSDPDRLAIRLARREIGRSEYLTPFLNTHDPDDAPIYLQAIKNHILALRWMHLYYGKQPPEVHPSYLRAIYAFAVSGITSFVPTECFEKNLEWKDPFRHIYNCTVWNVKNIFVVIKRDIMSRFEQFTERDEDIETPVVEALRDFANPVFWPSGAWKQGGWRLVGGLMGVCDDEEVIARRWKERKLENTVPRTSEGEVLVRWMKVGAKERMSIFADWAERWNLCPEFAVDAVRNLSNCDVLFFGQEGYIPPDISR